MRLLSFLTRKQAWLSPPEISKEFRPNGDKMSARTIHRWFSVLREKGGLVYYPYPRANALGLADILVTVHGIRDVRILGVIPFAAYFTAEISLESGEPLIRQGYWVPATAIGEFREFWRTARDLGLIRDFELFSSRNTNFIFSRFEDLITEDGSAVWSHPSDNSYFKTLIQQDLREPFHVKLGEPMTDAPLIIPMVVEHIWGYYSSRQVWEAIGQRDLSQVRKYVKDLRSRDLRRPGAALHMLQDQWDHLLQHFDEVFVQPRVFFDWPALKNSTFFTVTMQASSLDTMLDAVLQMSERSIVTSLRPSIELEGSCHISCFLPSDQLAPVARIAGGFHVGQSRPGFAVQDRAKTLELFQPCYCKLDWSCFEPSDLSWTFNGSQYSERLSTFKPPAIASSVMQHSA
jgi:hypothetical protein